MARSKDKSTRRGQQQKTSNGNGANLGFEAEQWLTADKLRNIMSAGMLVQSEKFVEEHGGRIGDIGHFYRKVPVRNGHFVHGVEVQIHHRYAG